MINISTHIINLKTHIKEHEKPIKTVLYLLIAVLLICLYYEYKSVVSIKKAQIEEQQKETQKHDSILKKIRQDLLK
jgi:Ca2+/Na+ antiporter